MSRTGYGELTPNAFQNQLRGKQSINNQIRAAAVESEFDITPTAVSTWRDVVVGDGTVSVDDLYNVTTAASGSSRSRLETAQIGNYLTGSISTVSIFAQKDTTPVGTVEVGYGRDGADNGMFLRWNSDDTYEVVLLRDGVETVIPQSQWYNDQYRPLDIDNENDTASGKLWGFEPADGISTDGESGIICDMRNGQQYQFSVSWGGPILFSIDAVDRFGHDHSVPIFLFDPRDGNPVMTQPNQPVFGEIRNEGTAQSETLKIGGRQFIHYGSRASTISRSTEHINVDVSVGTTSYVPIMAFRRKTPDYEGVSLQLSDLGVLTDNTMHVFVEKDPTFDTAGTWSTPLQHEASETAIEVQDDPDAQVDGTKWDGFIAGSGKNQRTITAGSGKEMPIARDKPIVVYAKSISGNVATASFSVNVKEFW